MSNLLNGGAEVPHWRRKHHGRFHHQGRHGWNSGCPSGANAEANPPTATAGCNKGAKKPDSKPQCPYQFYVDQAKETASTFQASHPEYLSGLSNTIASVMEGLGLGNVALYFFCFKFGFHIFACNTGFGGVAGSCPRSSAPQPETKKEEHAKEDMKAEAKNTKPEAKKEVIIPVTLEDNAFSTSAPNTNPYAQLVDAIAAARAVETANAKAVDDFANQAAVAAARKHVEAMANAEICAPKVNCQFGMTSQTGTTAPVPSRAVAEAVAEAVALAPSQAVAEAVAEAAASAPTQAVADAVAKAAADNASQTADAEVMIEAITATDLDSSIRQQNVDVAAGVKPRSRRGDSGDWTIVDHGTETPSTVAATSPEPSLQFESARPKDETEMSLLEKAPSHPGRCKSKFRVRLRLIKFFFITQILS